MNMSSARSLRFIIRFLSAHPAKSIRLTEQGYPMTNRDAIHSLLTRVLSRNRPANRTFRLRHFRAARPTRFRLPPAVTDTDLTKAKDKAIAIIVGLENRLAAVPMGKPMRLARCFSSAPHGRGIRTSAPPNKKAPARLGGPGLS